MSHAMGVKCRGCKTEIQPDWCPEGCPEGHGFTFVVCPACEAVAEACRCAGFYLACDRACPDFWPPDVPMTPNKGHDPMLTIETIEGRTNPEAPRPKADDPRPDWVTRLAPNPRVSTAALDGVTVPDDPRIAKIRALCESRGLGTLWAELMLAILDGEA